MAGPAPGFPFVAGDSFSVTCNWQASFRGRLGYARDRHLLYATGGIAWTGVSDNTNFIATGGFPASLGSDRTTFDGPTLGGGLEYAITNNVSLGVDGLYTLGTAITPLMVAPSQRSASRQAAPSRLPRYRGLLI